MRYLFITYSFIALLSAVIIGPVQAQSAKQYLGERQPWPCMDEFRQPMEIDNNLPINLKFHTENRYEARVFVSGIFVKLNGSRNKHVKFEIDLDRDMSTLDDRLEIIYNEKYGSMPQIQAGVSVLACGDYITANANEDGYEASPQGAIVHWVHPSEFPKAHPHGFLVIDGSLISSKK